MYIFFISRNIYRYVILLAGSWGCHGCCCYTVTLFSKRNTSFWKLHFFWRRLYAIGPGIIHHLHNGPGNKLPKTPSQNFGNMGKMSLRNVSEVCGVLWSLIYNLHTDFLRQGIIRLGIFVKNPWIKR